MVLVLLRHYKAVIWLYNTGCILVQHSRWVCFLSVLLPMCMRSTNFHVAKSRINVNFLQHEGLSHVGRLKGNTAVQQVAWKFCPCYWPQAFYYGWKQDSRAISTALVINKNKIFLKFRFQKLLFVTFVVKVISTADYYV